MKTAQNYITMDWQKQLVASALRGPTPEQVDAVAMLCMESREAGGNSSVWHQAAAYFRDGKNCNCVACRAA